MARQLMKGRTVTSEPEEEAGQPCVGEQGGLLSKGVHRRVVKGMMFSTLSRPINQIYSEATSSSAKEEPSTTRWHLLQTADKSTSAKMRPLHPFPGGCCQLYPTEERLPAFKNHPGAVYT